MDADFSVELAAHDPVLDFPWKDPDGKIAYFDLKRTPEEMARIEEAMRFPELADFLRAANSRRSCLESAKCDVWTTAELAAEEEIYGAPFKLASYVDLVSTAVESRADFRWHEQFAEKLVELLRRTPELSSAIEVCVRRCYYQRERANPIAVDEGFYFTLYVNGYGSDEEHARRNWAIALNLAGNAILQLSAATG
jgi:hypothetical protein